MIDPNFELDYLNEKLSVQTRELRGRVLFKVSFPKGADPLIVTQANDSNGEKFWTCVPEGRQEEAEQIGPLIKQYYRSKQQ